MSATYGAVHDRLKRQRGAASTHLCYFCGDPADEWAYDRTDADEVTMEVQSVQVVYSTDVNHYLPACRPCHRRMDGSARRKYCSKGHAFTIANTRRVARPQGRFERRCGECEREKDRARRAARRKE